jgi:hypothetical protein
MSTYGFQRNWLFSYYHFISLFPCTFPTDKKTTNLENFSFRDKKYSGYFLGIGTRPSKLVAILIIISITG